MSPLTEDTEQVAIGTTETIDPVDEAKDTQVEVEDPGADTVAVADTNDEVEQSNEQKVEYTPDETKESEVKKEDEKADVKTEETTPKSRDEIRMAFDPFFDTSSKGDSDKIAQESADAAKELASIFS